MARTSAKQHDLKQPNVKALPAPGRLYQEIAGKLIQLLASGALTVGDRLPPERDLVIQYGVSRPTVREAIIALEVEGLVETKVGSGVYVTRLPHQGDAPAFHVTAFELTEARIRVEGEAAALAATQVTDAELEQLEQLVRQISIENLKPDGAEVADRDFHLLIARITRNKAMLAVVEELWRMRVTSPDSALLHAKARAADIKPVVAEHSGIVAALRSRNPVKARHAMQAHLGSVLQHLLFVTEERAVEQAREAAASVRARYAHAVEL